MPAKYIPSDRLITVVSPTRIKYKDVFNVKMFYKALREWMKENNWKDIEEGGERFERFYGERVAQNKVKELWWRWRAIKTPPEIGKVTEKKTALTYYLDYDFHLVAITPTEIIQDGKKFKVETGEIEFFISAYIEENYKEELGEHGFLRYFKELFARRIYADTVEERKKELYQEIYGLQTYIKNWFKMKRYHPYGDVKEGFFLSEAYPSHLKGK